MKALVEAIQEQGVGVGSNIVKVDMFLNHRLDTKLLTAMGQAFADAFQSPKPDVILTVEASGIAVAVTTAIACGNIPVVFAKKSPTSNVTDAVYETPVYSFTHGQQNHIRVAKPYLQEGANVLIIDDFLANGEAAKGLCELVKQANGNVCGIGVCIEKSFQPGRAILEAFGHRVESLAKIVSINDGELVVEG